MYDCDKTRTLIAYEELIGTMLMKIEDILQTKNSSKHCVSKRFSKGVIAY